MRRRRNRQRAHHGWKDGTCSLGELNTGDRARIVDFDSNGSGSISEDRAFRMCRRLLQLGLLLGTEVEVKHEAPFGRDPIAVSVRGALIALRRNEANLVQVERLPSHA